MRNRVLVALVRTLLVGSLLASAGCSLYVDARRQQCSSDQECVVHNTPFAKSLCVSSVCTQPTAWECLGSVATSAPASGTAIATLALVDLISGAPMAGVNARVCRKLDVSCAEPLATELSSDGSGNIAITVPSGFDGYVELAPPNAMSSMYFFYPPVTVSRKVFPIPLLSAASLTYLSQLANVQLSPERSVVFLGAHNCLDEPAGGVAFSSTDADAATVPFYLIQGIPSATAKETDSTGRGGLLNMRTGSVTVTGRLSTGSMISTSSVVTRKGQVTYAALVPSPN